MRIALWVVGALLLLLLAVSGYFFKFVITRESIRLKSKDFFNGASPWAKYQAAVDEGAAWLRAAEKEDVWLDSFDGLRLHAYFLPAAGRAKRAVLCAHGYRGSYDYDFSGAARWLHENGCDLLLIDERAHGRSEGHYICYGAKERFDVRDWANWLDKRYDGALPVYLDGLSMGAATVLMASGLVLPGSVRGIVADCGFTSPRAIFEHNIRSLYHLPVYPLLWFFGLYCRVFAKFGLGDASTLDALRVNTRPVLLVHGGADNFVPTRMSRENYDACTAPKELYIVEGVGHAASYPEDPKTYQEKVLALFGRCEG
ncbi:MAG: alpha/beta hydrolase [Oscillospiraceae bacterium]|nr:alpha/beta hydrolase [Oscillospiraceae bacterium]